MSEEADDSGTTVQTSEDSHKPTKNDGERDATAATTTPSSSSSPPPPLPLPPPPPPPPPQPTTTSTGRRPRFGTGGPPPSPYMWIDGRQLRSALAWTKKSSLPRRVSFPSSDNHLVTGYLEPANPWRHGEHYYWIMCTIFQRCVCVCVRVCVCMCGVFSLSDRNRLSIHSFIAFQNIYILRYIHTPAC